MLPCGHLLGWPLGARLWCLIMFLSLFLCDILGQVWYYLIVTVPDLGHLSYFQSSVDPYQIASSEANLSGSTLFSEKHK